MNAPDDYSPDAPTCDGDGNLPPRRCCRDRGCPCDVEPGECPGCRECDPCPDCGGTGDVAQAVDVSDFAGCSRCEDSGHAER